MAGATTEHAQVVIKAGLSFLWGQLSIFTKLVGDKCRVSRGGLRFFRLLSFIRLVVLVAVVRLDATRSPIFLVVRFVAVRLVLSSAGFLRGVPNDGSRCGVQGFSFQQVLEASLADP